MLIATFHLDFDAVALGDAFEDVPDMTVEAERIAAHGTEWTMPCVWVSANDFDAVDDALAGDPTVDQIIETNEFETEKYYHIDWDDRVDERIDAFVDHEGSILRADASGDGWEIEFRFVNRDQFDAFRATLQDRGHDFELVEIYEPGTPRQTTAGLTPAQRDALVTAVERGYFEIPRETAMRELADELETSPQALSELLRRGTENLVTSILRTTTADDISLGDSGT